MEGVQKLGRCHHDVIADCIETGTYLIAAAFTGGRIKDTDPSLLDAVLHKLKPDANRDRRQLDQPGHGKAAGPGRSICAPRTQPCHNMQAQFTALNTVAEGTGTIVETVFENRFMHVQEMNRMGADIEAGQHRHLPWRGQPHRRAGDGHQPARTASLVIAALVAEGGTTVQRIYHIDQGYECIEEKLQSLGAVIRRVPGW